MAVYVFQVPDGSNINIGCGCGTGSGGSGSGGVGVEQPTLPPGGTAGGDYSGRARVIDICANVKTIFQDPLQDWIDTAQNRGYLPGLGEDIVSTFPIVNSDLIDSVQESLMEIQAELYGEKWTTEFKRWIVRYFDDPFPGFGGGFASYQGRIELINLAAYKAPLLVAGAPFWPAIVVWALTADIAALNQRIKSSAGTASYVGECAELQRQAGREPYQPPQLLSSNVEEFTTSQGYLVRYYSINTVTDETSPKYLGTVPTGYELVAYAGSMRKARSTATARCTMTTKDSGGTETDTATWFTNENDPAEWNEIRENVQLELDVMDEVYNQFGNGRARTAQDSSFAFQPDIEYGWRITNDDTSVQVNDYAFVFREIV